MSTELRGLSCFGSSSDRDWLRVSRRDALGTDTSVASDEWDRSDVPAEWLSRHAELDVVT